MISNKYKILDKINSGNFGVVYAGENIRTNEKVAIKIIEKKDEIIFKNECFIYKSLGNSIHFPKLKWVYISPDYYVLVLTLLGESIQTFKKYTLQEDKLKEIALMIFYKISLLHNMGIIHRDIKTNNCVKDLHNDTDIYLLDFSFSTFVIDEFGNNIINKGITNIIGSKYFCSLNIHARQTPTRRDDLESACYVIGDLINCIEWSGLTDESQIIKKKEMFGSNINLPWLTNLYRNIRELDFNESLAYSDIETYISGN